MLWMLSSGLRAFCRGVNRAVLEAKSVLFSALLKPSSEFIESTMAALLGTKFSIEWIK